MNRFNAAISTGVVVVHRARSQDAAAKYQLTALIGRTSTAIIRMRRYSQTYTRMPIRCDLADSWLEMTTRKAVGIAVALNARLMSSWGVVSIASFSFAQDNSSWNANPFDDCSRQIYR